jgi:hypothetical protein
MNLNLQLCSFEIKQIITFFSCMGYHLVALIKTVIFLLKVLGSNLLEMVIKWKLISVKIDNYLLGFLNIDRFFKSFFNNCFF